MNNFVLSLSMQTSIIVLFSKHEEEGYS